MLQTRLVWATVTVLAMSDYAFAGPIYGFHKTSNNGGVEVADWLTVEVADAGSVGSSNFVDFIFRYDPAAASVAGAGSFIDGVYFDDGTLLEIAEVIDGPGVDFDDPAHPGHLPDAAGFNTTADFTADIASGGAANGVNPGERVTIRFALFSPFTYADTLAAIPDNLQFGIKMQGLAPNDNSESYVSDGNPVVPLPAAAWMGLTLLGSVGSAGFFRRRYQRALA